jgi:hypothetical protein
MAREHGEQRSSLTAVCATARSHTMLLKLTSCMPCPSETRVGSFHVPARRASAVPTPALDVGAQP